MAKDALKQATNERRGATAPVEPAVDPLLAAAADEPFFAPREPEVDRRRGDARSSNGAIWFFGAVVTALLIVQSIELLGARPLAPHEPATQPTREVATTDPERETTDDQKIDRLLRESRTGVDRGVYETAIRLLEPLLEQPTLLSKSQRMQAYMLLSQAHRALKNVPKAQAYYLRAIDQSIDRHEPAVVLEDAGSLRDDGRFAESRRKLSELLARRDGLDKDDEVYATLAAARIADSWYAQAVATGQLAPLPDLEREEQR